MSSPNLRAAGLHTSPIVAAALAGLIAAIPAGIILQFGTDLMPLLGGLSGTDSVAVGWIVHLLLSVVFGAMFGWMVEWPLFRTLTDTTGGAVAIGIIHGVVWYAYIVIGIVIPGIVRLLGYDPFGIILAIVPGTAEGTGSLLSAGAFSLAYLVWGAILGFAYAAVEAESAEPEARGPDATRE